MRINFCLDIQNSRLQSILSGIDSGIGAGRILLLTDPIPAPMTTLGTSVLVATIQLQRPCGQISGDILTLELDQSQDIVVVNDGTITWGRFVNSEGLPQIDVDASDFAGTGVIRVDNPVQIRGNLISPILMQIKEP